jgi:hypothetical protein
MLTTMRAFVGCTFFALALASSALAQSGVGVELDEITDNRLSEGMMTGGCELRVKLTGNGLDKAQAARIVVKEAKDDRGTSLYNEPMSNDFTARDVNNGTIQFSLKQPARAATTVRIKGTVELYVPGRDPGSIVKVDKALAKPDAPLASKGLKAAKVDLTLLSRAGYATLMKTRKLTEADIEKIRAEGKKRGVSEKEVEAMIGFAKAMEGMDGDTPEGAVILSGKKDAFDRVFRVEILGTDGKPVDVGSHSTSTRGDDSIMTMQPNQPPPANASLQFSLLTDKSRLSFPFELSVPLP